ncbi:DNA polymerase III subunit beta [bacterium]|nr:DNA polymerase III subunit beta [bacterium]
MKISINRNILLEALQLAVNISPKTTSDPIINNTLIETLGEKEILVKATNHENSVYGEFEANVISPGKICVGTSKLFNLVRELKDTLLEIDSTPQNWVYITSGNSKIKLPGVEPDQFPIIEFKKMEREFSLSSGILKNAIDRTFFAIGENESRKNLMGLNLKIELPNLISWTGADSFRISQYNTELDESALVDSSIIVPKKSLLDIKRVLDHSDEKVVISFDDNVFQVFSKTVKYKTRLIEAEYPNLGRLVNGQSIYSVILPKFELLNAVKILSTITEGDSKSVMKLTFQEGRVTLESQKLEFGEGNDVIFCDYVGEEMAIGLNIKFFLDAIQAFDNTSDDNVVLNFTKPEAPFIIQCQEWDNYKTVLMPVRIQW